MTGVANDGANFAHTLVLGLGIVGVLVLLAAVLLAAVDAALHSIAFGQLVLEFLAWRRQGKPDRKQARMEERRRCADLALIVAKDLDRTTDAERQRGADREAVSAALAARGTALRIADAILAESHTAGTSERAA